MNLRGRQGEEVPLGNADDRGAVGEVVRFHEERSGNKHCDAQRRKGGHRENNLAPAERQ